jgi:redox-sensitive bicupin YhaK (pirin superfamily)
MNPRPITHRTRGSSHGFIRRLVSPGDLGEALKPFVFLDHVAGRVTPGTGFGWHPHSGIATLTYALDADLAYEDTTGQRGTVQATGLEWMCAGGAAWHTGHVHPHQGSMTAFQLWVSLPPALEEAPCEGLYVAPGDVPQVGNVRVLLGNYGGATCPIPAPSPMLYLDIVLEPGVPWRFEPPEGHTVAWAFVYRGTVGIAGEDVTDELVALGRGSDAITLEARTPARVLFGSAQPHAHPLVLGTHSVHTNRDALRRSVARIGEVGRALQQAGRLGC